MSRDFWRFLAPLLLFVVAWILLPVLGTIDTSFWQDVTFLPHRWAGVSNYVYLVKDPGFWQSLRFTLLFTGVAVPLELALGLALALLLNEPLPLRGLLRTCALLPWAIPVAVSGRVWELIFNYEFGLANFLVRTLRLSPHPVHWLGGSWSAFGSLVLADAWKTVPFTMLLLLAGLQNIPEELYAQAAVDRANLWQRFTRITLPLLKPVIAVAALFRSIDSLRIFDLIYVLTHGGPGGATNSLSMYSLRAYLAGDFGYGSAVAVVLFCAAFLLSAVYVRQASFAEVLR